MGSFGAYKHAYSKYKQELEEREREFMKNEPVLPEPQTVWVTKRYIPTDLRSTAPVPRHKLLAPKVLPKADSNWVPNMDPPLRSFERPTGPLIFVSHPSSRCEEFSTLRQMFPSTGSSWKESPPSWGTSYGFPPLLISRPPKRFPKINSPMTRYVIFSHFMCNVTYVPPADKKVLKKLEMVAQISVGPSLLILYLQQVSILRRRTAKILIRLR